YISGSVLFLLLTACSDAPQETWSQRLKSRIAVAQPEDGPQIVVHERSDYDETFLAGLEELPFGRIELNGPLVILNRQDSLYLPGHPKAGRTTVLTGIQDGLAVAVHL